MSIADSVPAPALKTTRTPIFPIALVAGLVAIAGSFGPWSTITGAKVSGMEGDGSITLGIAIFAGLLVLVVGMSSRRPRFGAHWFALIAAALVPAIAIIDMADIGSSASGWGIWAVAVGGIVLTLACLLLAAGAMKRPKR